jgi:hypothetical protein
MTLTLVLGCFPLDLGPYRSKSVYFFSLFSYSWVFILLNLLVPYTSIQLFETRYLYSFRRKPAISKFDWHFTSMHKSSQIIATITSSFLLHLLRVLSNCSCIDHSVSGPIFLDCTFRFHFAFACPTISLANPLYKRYVILFYDCSGLDDFRVFSP